MDNLQVRIKRPPARAADLEVVETERPRLTNGSFLARALWLAVDPFRCATDAAAPGSPRPGDVVPARGVGQVVESRHDVFSVGSLVELDCGLQQLCVSAGVHARLLHPGQTPASTALGVLGAPGMAAYFGLLHLARLRAGETVLVSAAANAAGAMAGQIAMLKGARAIGIAGSREKCDWVTRHARLSACINYGADNLQVRLRQLAPKGVDVYFDNVGGEMLEAVVTSGVLARGARIVQNSFAPMDAAALLHHGGHAPGALQVLHLSLQDYEHRRGEFLREAIAWYGAGRIATKDHVVEGLANAPAHLLLAMQGGNFGRPLVRL
ncbi:MAG: NADP-dependent oxidoreductase [Gammaproteobacteria bacterium]|nr:NADP-dependent oxidoreductase [Gammaproteobacteria bacterium]